MDETEFQREVDQVLAQGEANQEVVRLATNFCRLMEVQRAPFSGVGIPEQVTGLPISPRQFSCVHADNSGTVAFDAQVALLRFYDDNCTNCSFREPVALPNLLELVAERDRREKEREDRVRARLATAEKALADREERRQQVAGGAREDERGLIALLRDLDVEESADVGHRLVEAAKAAPDRFSPEIRELLFELARTKGGSTMASVLQAIEALGVEPKQIVDLARAAIEEGRGSRDAAMLLARLCDHLDVASARAAVPALLSLAAPDAHLVGFGRSRGPDPRPLICVYRGFPEVVTEVIQVELRGGSVWDRRHAAFGAQAIIRFDQSAVEPFLRDLVRSLLLPDDRYHAHPVGAAEDALSVALIHAPDLVDKEIRRVGNRTGARERARLFGVFERHLRLYADESPDEPVRVAFDHIVEALTEPVEGDHLREAVQALERATASHPHVVVGSINALLGAAAALAVLVDAEPDPSPLDVPGVAELRALELMNRRQGAYYALQGIVDAVSGLSATHPDDAASAIGELFEALDSSHARLLEALVKGLGTMASRREGIRTALPGLYVGMMSDSTLVRAGAAEAYGKVTRRFAEDLPELLHEVFLLLLSDPFVIVHKAAVRALERGRVPTAFRNRALVAVQHIVLVYLKSRDDDRFLSKALDVLYTLHQPAERTRALKRFALAVLGTIDPNSAWDSLKWLARDLKEEPGFVEVVLSLLRNEEIYPFYVDDITELLEDAPVAAIAAAADSIADVGQVVRDRSGTEGSPTRNLLRALSNALAWDQAAQLVEAWLQDPTAAYWPGFSKSVGELSLAVEVERAVASSDAVGLRRALVAWEGAEHTESHFASNFAARVRALDALEGPDQISAESLEALAGEMSAAGASMGEPGGMTYGAYATCARAIARVIQWSDAVRRAQADADRFLRSARLLADDAPSERLKTIHPTLARLLLAIRTVDEHHSADELLADLRAVSLPLPLKEASSPPFRGVPTTERPPLPARSPVAVVSFELDGAPLTNGTLVRPNTLHDLTVKVAMSTWPADATALVLYPASVERVQDFDLPTFRLIPSNEGTPVSLTATGRLVLRTPQTLRSRALQFTFHGDLVTANGTQSVSLEGQRHFVVRAYDPKAEPQTGFTPVDETLVELREGLRAVHGLTDQDRDDLLTLAAGMGSLAARALASNLYAGSDWTERRWQDDVREELRRIPQVGEELEEHPSIAGGVTDLSYRRTRLELKVEKDAFVTPENAKDFIPQTAQYVVGSHKRLGLLAILDASKKTTAPPAVANDLFLEVVAPPAGGSYPIAILVVIVRGNLAQPSRLSH